MILPEAKVRELEKVCLQRGWTVGCAESCTGGLLASALTAHPGVSTFFQGGVISYSGAVKAEILRVPKSLMQVHGEVSLPVALSMARGAREALGCTWSVSITGVAGPSGGSAEKPVGFVCFAIAGPGFEKAVQQQFDDHGGRQDIQRQAALFAFDLLSNAMR